MIFTFLNVLHDIGRSENQSTSNRAAKEDNNTDLSHTWLVITYQL